VENATSSTDDGDVMCGDGDGEEGVVCKMQWNGMERARAVEGQVVAVVAVMAVDYEDCSTHRWT